MCQSLVACSYDPDLAFLTTLDLLHHWELVWWVWGCGWPQLMPLDLLCLLRGCRTVLVAAEFPACLAPDFSQGTALAAPAGQQQSGHLLVTADGSWSMSVHEKRQVFLGGWTFGNIWRCIILMGYCLYFFNDQYKLYCSVIMDGALSQKGNRCAFWWH